VGEAAFCLEDPESRHELFAQAILPLADLFCRLQLLYFLTPMLKVPATLVEQIVVQLFAGIVAFVLYRRPMWQDYRQTQ